VHKACIEVDETGTTAGAATAIEMDLGEDHGEPKEMNMTHPFIYLIIDRQSGAILFGGRVNDPTREK
jgi:serpin B